MHQKYWLIPLLALTFSISACTFEEPVLPKWFSDWRLPIPNPGFVMSEAVNDSTIIDTTYEGQSIIAISIMDSSERKQISREDLAFLPEGDQASQEIGDVSLNSPGTEESDPVLVSSFLGIPIVPGATVDIPASVETSPPIFLTYSSFEFVVDVKEGTIVIEFVNNSFLDFGTNTKISIYDSTSNTFLGDALFQQDILAGTSQLSNPVDLAGSELRNHLRFIMELDILAKPDYTFTPADENASIQFLSTMSELKVGYAMAQIPEQNFSRQDSVSTADREDRMITANIEFGAFLLEIENTLEVSADVAVELLNFYQDPDYTQVLSLNYSVEALQKDTFTVELDDLYLTDYNNMPTPGSFIDYMKYRFFVTTIPTEEMVEIYETDVVILSITPVDSVYLREFKGDLARREFPIDPIEENDVLDTEGFEGSLRFEETTMTINVSNQIGIPLEVDLDITGLKNNQTESIKLTFDQNPIIVGARMPGEDVNEESIVLNKDNSNLVEFLEFLPEDIITEGTTYIEGEGEVSRRDEVWSDYHIFSPFFLKLQNDARYSSEVEGSEVDESTQNAILRGDVDNFMIDLILSNGLPIGADLKIYLSASRDSIFDETITDPSRHLIIDDIRFLAGELGPDNFVVAKYQDEYQIPLSQDSLQIFVNDSIFIGSKVLLDDTEGLVKFRSTDEIRANGAIRIRYRINNED